MPRTDSNMLEVIARNLRDTLGLRGGGMVSIDIHDVSAKFMDKLHKQHDMDRVVPDDTSYAIASMRGSFIWDHVLPPSDGDDSSTRVITMGDSGSHIQISFYLTCR